MGIDIDVQTQMGMHVERDGGRDAADVGMGRYLLSPVHVITEAEPLAVCGG